MIIINLFHQNKSNWTFYLTSYVPFFIYFLHRDKNSYFWNPVLYQSSSYSLSRLVYYQNDLVVLIFLFFKCCFYWSEGVSNFFYFLIESKNSYGWKPFCFVTLNFFFYWLMFPFTIDFKYIFYFFIKLFSKIRFSS